MPVQASSKIVNATKKNARKLNGFRNPKAKAKDTKSSSSGFEVCFLRVNTNFVPSLA